MKLTVNQLCKVIDILTHVRDNKKRHDCTEIEYTQECNEDTKVEMSDGGHFYRGVSCRLKLDLMWEDEN